MSHILGYRKSVSYEYYLVKVFATAFTIATKIHMGEETA